jgi:hypothetical protein
MVVRIAAALLGCRGIEITIGAEPRLEYEAPVGERQPGPELDGLPVAMMIRNMAFVEPHEACGEIFAESFLIIEGPCIGMRVARMRGATEQREFLCMSLARGPAEGDHEYRQRRDRQPVGRT